MLNETAPLEQLAGQDVVITDHDQPHPPPFPVSCHPLAQAVRRIWGATRGAGVFELLLDGGDKIMASSFSAELSQHEYGVFSQCAEGQPVSVVIVPWDTVRRTTLKTRLDEPPADLFGPI
jgi:hypothetical protein